MEKEEAGKGREEVDKQMNMEQGSEQGLEEKDKEEEEKGEVEKGGEDNGDQFW